MHRFAHTLALLTSVTHIFCCGLPLVMSIIGLGTVIGLSGIHAIHDVMHQYEVDILIGSGILLAIGGIVQIIAWRLDCREDGACTHTPCAPKKNKSLILLLLAATFYIINLLMFAFGAIHPS